LLQVHALLFAAVVGGQLDSIAAWEYGLKHVEAEGKTGENVNMIRLTVVLALSN